MQDVSVQRSVPGERDAAIDEGRRRVLWVRGALDAAAATELLTRVRDVSERDVVVDLGLVRELDEVGVAAIARLAAASGDRRVALRGISSRTLRLLRLLGARLSRIAAAHER